MIIFVNDKKIAYHSARIRLESDFTTSLSIITPNTTLAVDDNIIAQTNKGNTIATCTIKYTSAISHDRYEIVGHNVIHKLEKMSSSFNFYQKTSSDIIGEWERAFNVVVKNNMPDTEITRFNAQPKESAIAVLQRLVDYTNAAISSEFFICVNANNEVRITESINAIALPPTNLLSITKRTATFSDVYTIMPRQEINIYEDAKIIKSVIIYAKGSNHSTIARW